MTIARAFLCLSLAFFVSGRAAAQIDGAATSIIVPLVASTASFTSEITVKDQSGTTRSVSMTFYEAAGSASPGAKVCTPVSLAGFATVTVTLGSQCGLGAGGHFGFVILTDSGTARDKLFYAFSRTSNPQGIGFSVEGFPVGHIGGGETYSEVAGVKRKAATASRPNTRPTASWRRSTIRWITRSASTTAPVPGR